MKKSIFFLILVLASSYISMSQPGTGQPQTNQVSEIYISTGTQNTDLIYKVNGRNGKLFQVYLGTKLLNSASLNQLRDAGHQAGRVIFNSSLNLRKRIH